MNEALLSQLAIKILVYGVPKKGKTRDMVRTWASGTEAPFIVGDPDSVIPHFASLGLPYNTKRFRRVPEDIPHLQALLERGTIATLRGYREKGRVIPLLIDDWSLLCDATMAKVEADNEGNKNKFKKIDEFRACIHEFMDQIQLARIPVHLNAHEARPENTVSEKTKQEVFYMGGPAMALRTIRDWIPSISTEVYRLAPDKTRPDNAFQVSCFCDPADEQYIMGSRLNIPKRSPVNTAELLRSVGKAIPWPAPIAEVAAQHLDQLATAVLDEQLTAIAANRELLSKCPSGLSRSHQLWLLQDLTDRIEIRRCQQNELDRFLKDPPKEDLAAVAKPGTKPVNAATSQSSADGWD